VTAVVDVAVDVVADVAVVVVDVVEVDDVAKKDPWRLWEGPMPPPLVPAFKTLVEPSWNWLLAGSAARQGGRQGGREE
jgi:hypothetical protein